MDASKLKTAVLGLNDAGRLLLSASRKSGYFQIEAVADKDGELARRVAEEYKCAAYDDYRQFIIQNQFDCLLIAESMHNCDEYLRMAIKKKSNILKTAPCARNFEEAAQFVQMAKDEDVKFAVATTGRFAQSFLALRLFLLDPTEKQTEDREQKTEDGRQMTANGWEPFLVTAFCAVCDKNTQGWQTDPKLAGGGVLLYDCYELIDQIVLNFGIPRQVYCLSTNTADDKRQRLYLTEDTVVVIMKYSDSLLVSLVASKAFRHDEKRLVFYGKDRTVIASEDEFVVSDNSTHENTSLRCEADELTRTATQLENFALSIISPASNKLCASGLENLKNMAVIESAYLSAKTAVPESPAKILEMQRLTL